MKCEVDQIMKFWFWLVGCGNVIKTQGLSHASHDLYH